MPGETKWSVTRRRDGVAIREAGIFLPFGAEEVAERIVACVNACVGLPTEALEAGALGDALRLAVDILGHTDSECDFTNCETKAGLDAALRALGRLTP